MIGRRGLWLWLAGATLLAAILAALAIGGRFQIHSDVLALLPAPQRDPVRAAAIERIGDLGQRRLVVLVAAGDPKLNTRVANAAAQALARSDAFIDVVRRADDLLSPAQRQAVSKLHFGHRFHLLAPADRRALARLAAPPEADDAAALRHFIGRAQARLYGIGAGAATTRFIEDPLGLSAAYRGSLLAGLALPGLTLASDGSFYVAGEDGRRFAVLFARSKSPPFTLEAQAAQLAALEQAREAAQRVAPGAVLLVSGVLPHAAAATNQARNEVAVIGTGSLAGILLLMLWAFGSVRPFLLGLTVMAGGCLLALVVTTALFGPIHSLTLVFGASIVGVAIDYCLHFFTQRWETPAPRRAIRCILPAISLGLMTNVLAYGGMAVAPFPGLRQMAVFAAFGLIGAWLGVVLLLPACAGAPPRSGAALGLAQAWLQHGPARLAAANHGRLLWYMGAALVVSSVLALAFLKPADDIGLLYEAPAALRQIDQRVARLLGTRSAGQTIAIVGDSPAAVLQAEADLAGALRGPKPVANVSAITDAFPTVAEQRRDYERLARTLYAPGGPVQQLLAGVGYSSGRIEAHRAAFAAQRGKVLRFDEWLASPASIAARPLWLGRIEDQWAALLLVHQVHDRQALARILEQRPQVFAVDPAAQISRILGHYRDLATWLLGGAYVLAWLLLCWPLGTHGAFAVILSPMLASAIALLVFAVTGWPFSLFNVLAMLLLLGLGADYGIFLRMAGRNNAPAMLAVGASAVTNLLAFGLLALSATPALHSFGLTLALGLTLTFLFASLAGGSATGEAPAPG